MEIVKANVLIDEAGHARLADFGLLTIISDATSLASSSSVAQGGTHRWMSPELFDPENFGLKDGRPTKHSDCYALGMLVYEVLSGKIPFSRHHGYAVVVRIMRGERPARPQGGRGMWFTNEVWDTLERCWNPISGDRPRIKYVQQCLENASISWVPPSHPTPQIPDSSDEESTDEGEVYFLSQEVSCQSRQNARNHDPDENDAINSSRENSVPPPSAPDHQDLRASVENPNGTNSEELAGILNTVS